MKFKESLKHIKVGQEVGRIENSGRIFPCFVCNEVTGWRNNGDGTTPGVPCCSDECLDTMDDWSKEIGSDTSETDRISRSAPVLVGAPPVDSGECQTHERESDDEEEAAA